MTRMNDHICIMSMTFSCHINLLTLPTLQLLFITRQITKQGFIFFSFYFINLTSELRTFLVSDNKSIN